MLPILAFFSITFAQEPPQPVYKESNLVIVAEDQTINKDFFGTGEVVQIDGTVHGDVYAAGERVDITGTVNGDVLAVGGIVNISGTVTDDVRVAGGQINVTGSIGKNLTAAGGNVLVDESAQLNGSVVSAGGNISMNAPVQKDAKLAGGTISIGNIIQGDADIFSRQLTMLPKGHINGQTTHVQTMPHKLQQQVDEAKRMNSGGTFIFFILIEIIAYFMFGLFLIHMLPVFMKETADAFRVQTFKSLLLGSIFIFVTPVVALMFMATIIGIPLGALFLVAYGFSVFVAQIVFSFTLGLFIKEKFKQDWHDGWSYMLGLLVYILVSSIPLIGWAFAFVVTIIGFGALIIAKKDIYMSLRKKKLI
jgi:cytoskeletal protein CcmA (bactofilin family)